MSKKRVKENLSSTEKFTKEISWKTIYKDNFNSCELTRGGGGIICFLQILPYRSSQICLSFFFSFSQTLSDGIPHDKGFDISPKIPVAASSVPPM